LLLVLVAKCLWKN